MITNSKRFFLGLTLVAAVSSTVFATPARADSDTPNMLLVNAGDLLGGVVSLEYERALASHFGLSFGLSVWTFRGVFSPPSEPTFTGISPEFGARFHFIRDAPGGLWFGPYLTAGYLFSRSDDELTHPWAWGLGAALGYNFIIGRHFTLQLGGGGGFTDVGGRLVWSPRLRVGLGVAF